MTTIEKMDLALDIVYKNKHKRITLIKFIDEFMTTFKITVVDLGGCINILKEDGYIREFEDEQVKESLKDHPFQDEARQHYTFLVITMKGMLFKENNGYKGAKRNKRWRRIRNVAVTALTLLIGCATVFVAVLQYRVSTSDILLQQEVSSLQLKLSQSDSIIQSQQYYIEALTDSVSYLKNTTDK